MGQLLSSLQPAPSRDVSMYLPYYQGTRRDMLATAMTLYQHGNLEGERAIDGGESIPFLATWSVLPLPADLTRCRLQFSGDADLSYEVTLTNFEFVKLVRECAATFDFVLLPWLALTGIPGVPTLLDALDETIVQWRLQDAKDAAQLGLQIGIEFLRFGQAEFSLRQPKQLV